MNSVVRRTFEYSVFQLQLTILKTASQEMEERIEEEEREMAKNPSVNWNLRRKVKNMLKL